LLIGSRVMIMVWVVTLKKEEEVHVKQNRESSM